MWRPATGTLDPKPKAIGEHRIAPEFDGYLIDGQQRLTSLEAAFGLYTGEDRGVELRCYLDLGASDLERSRETRLIVSYAGNKSVARRVEAGDSTLIPVSLLFEGQDYELRRQTEETLKLLPGWNAKRTDQQATKENILRALKRLAGTQDAAAADAPAALEKLKATQPEDAVFIYFAGHRTAQGQRFYLLPHDLGYAGERTRLDVAGLQIILEHGISDEELERAVEGIDADKFLMVIDACNSGQALEAEEQRRGPMNSKCLAQLAYKKGMYILTAAQSYQAAQEASQLGHGLLTYALVEEGLKQGAADSDPKDGEVWLREWFDYASTRVPNMQLEKMKQARGVGLNLSFVAGEERVPVLERRATQTPRVFYRRESEVRPLIVAKR